MRNKTLLIVLICVFFVGISASYAGNVDGTQNIKYKTAEQTADKKINSSTISNTNSTKTLGSGENKKPTKLSQDSILVASEYTNKYVSKNGKLPNYVTISDYKFSMPEFMYLLAKTVQYKYKGSNSKVAVSYGISNPTNPMGTNIKGTISSKDYYNYTTRIANYIADHDTAPNFVNVEFGQMQYQAAIHSFTKILSSIDNNKLPKSISLMYTKTSSLNQNIPKYKRPSINQDEKVSTVSKGLVEVTNLSGREGLTKLQKYMNKNLNHNGGSSTAAGVSKKRAGDCWGLAEWAAIQLKANGYDARIVQGASSSASNHRWVQVKLDNNWVNFESSLVTKRYGSKHYSTTCARASTVVKYL